MCYDMGIVTNISCYMSFMHFNYACYVWQGPVLCIT